MRQYPKMGWARERHTYTVLKDFLLKRKATRLGYSIKVLLFDHF